MEKPLKQIEVDHLNFLDQFDPMIAGARELSSVHPIGRIMASTLWRGNNEFQEPGTEVSRSEILKNNKLIGIVVMANLSIHVHDVHGNIVDFNNWETNRTKRDIYNFLNGGVSIVVDQLCPVVIVDTYRPYLYLGHVGTLGIKETTRVPNNFFAYRLGMAKAMTRAYFTDRIWQEKKNKTDYFGSLRLAIAESAR